MSLPGKAWSGIRLTPKAAMLAALQKRLPPQPERRGQRSSTVIRTSRFVPLRLSVAIST